MKMSPEEEQSDYCKTDEVETQKEYPAPLRLAVFLLKLYGAALIGYGIGMFILISMASVVYLAGFCYMNFVAFVIHAVPGFYVMKFAGELRQRKLRALGLFIPAVLITLVPGNIFLLNSVSLRSTLLCIAVLGVIPIILLLLYRRQL